MRGRPAQPSRPASDSEVVGQGEGPDSPTALELEDPGDARRRRSSGRRTRSASDQEVRRRVREALLATSTIERAARRLRDAVGAALGIVLLSPVLLLITIAIKLDSEGPVLYRQLRTGRDRRDRSSDAEGGRRSDDLGGRPFIMYKFRTMRADAELVSGVQWAREADGRVTRLGSFLRKWKLDELPQLLNVLVGDMSLVGPRPERPAFVSKLTRTIPEYALRHEVRPGITGWAQIHQGGDRHIEDVRRKLEYDLSYICRRSLLLDFKIMAYTPLVLVRSWLQRPGGSDVTVAVGTRRSRGSRSSGSAADADESSDRTPDEPTAETQRSRSRPNSPGVRTAFASIAALAGREDAPISLLVMGPTEEQRLAARSDPTDLEELCRLHVRGADLQVPLSDGEVGIVAYDTRVDGARNLVDRLERRVAESRGLGEEGWNPSLSAGVVEVRPSELEGATGRRASGGNPSSAAGAGERLEALVRKAAAGYERARRNGGGVRIVETS